MTAYRTNGYDNDICRVYDTGLNEKYTFDTFIVGESNKLAHSYALSVAAYPACSYNPLLIIGYTGCGKTHLLQAIGNRIVENGHYKSVLYVTGFDFIVEAVALIGPQRWEREIRLRHKFRNVDCLLIDDIDDLADQKFAMSLLHKILHDMVDNGKIVVMTANVCWYWSSEESDNFQYDTFRAVEIDTPDQELCLSILRRKLDIKKESMDEVILQYIASEACNNDIRYLEEKLNRLLLMKNSSLPHKLTEEKGMENHLQKVGFRPAVINRISEYLEEATKSFWEKDTFSSCEHSVLTGFDRLDEAIGGLKRGGVYLLDGARGIGTTAFALCLANNISVKKEGCVLYLTNQSGSLILTKRIIRLNAKIAWNKDCRDMEDDEAIKEAASKLEKSCLYFYEARETTISALLLDNTFTTVYDLGPDDIFRKEKNNLDLILIDSLEEFNEDDWWHTLGEYTTMAWHYGCPVLVITKYGNNNPKDENHEPAWENFFIIKKTNKVSGIFVLDWADHYERDHAKKGIADLYVLQPDDYTTQKVQFAVLDEYGAYIEMDTGEKYI